MSRHLSATKCRQCDIPLVSEYAWHQKNIRPEGHAYHQGGGLCGRCWGRLERNGHFDLVGYVQPDRVRGPHQRTREETVEQYALLREERPGLTPAELAEVMGMRLSALDQALYRARKAGDDRAALPPRQRKAAPRPARRGLTPEDTAYRREEWAFLKASGVSIHEAAQRLGVTVRTLEKYEQ